MICTVWYHIHFFPSGIWPAGSDGTDINAVDRSHSNHLLATADDFGDVNLFSYPCSNTKVISICAGVVHIDTI